MTGNAGRGGNIQWDGLEEIFGKWGAVLAKTGIVLLIVLILFSLLTCCIVPILKKWCLRAMDKRLNLITDMQRAQMLSMLTAEQLVRRILLTQRREEASDSFPIPGGMENIKDEKELPERMTVVIPFL